MCSDTSSTIRVTWSHGEVTLLSALSSPEQLAYIPGYVPARASRDPTPRRHEKMVKCTCNTARVDAGAKLELVCNVLADEKGNTEFPPYECPIDLVRALWLACALFRYTFRLDGRWQSADEV